MHPFTWADLCKPREEQQQREEWTPHGPATAVYDYVAAVLLDIHAGARELEADLKYRVAGRAPEPRGGSDVNTRAALKSIVRLAEALDEEQVKAAARIVGRWATTARRLRDVDEAERWEPLPRRPGALPPPCDYCETYSLRWNRRSGEVRCCNPECLDADGRRGVRCIGVANEVDHVGANDDHRLDNLRAVCAPCHRTRTGRQGRAAQPKRKREPEPHPGMISGPRDRHTA
ncbi:hypothetical protein FHX41_1235 [Actinomadura hallensis]|uniref:HNH endonuclease n=1 Tax=Actinomadura hallensis TaxID=337895 RepID=A0A543IAN9_9ACTN|nr:HNH endonuclease signature motif containing protein [Actinomadura hallensis]TQM67617.1 hypothetical protein FHX41_1235 [Actinomadura hallensis]HLV74900.1 HNH endonuclease signature motif containing protein [Vulgatibacteraceae bacterium]